MIEFPKIDITDPKTAQRMIDFWVMEEGRINKEVALLQEEIEVIRKQIEFLKQVSIRLNNSSISTNDFYVEDFKNEYIIRPSKINDDGYFAQWTVANKAVFILNNVKQVLTIKQIVAYLCELENISKSNIRQLIGNYSSTLGTNAQKKKIFGRIKMADVDEFKYGLIDWFNPITGMVHSRYNHKMKHPDLGGLLDDIPVS